MATYGSSAPEGFTRGAETYDEAVRQNIAGSDRLVMSLPHGDYRRVLDVGCGTGWTSAAMVRRFGVETITGVDASEGMLERFGAKLGSEFPDVQVELRTEDVMEMGVPDGEFDAVLCVMALHWFTDKTAAVARMARALRPGGVLGILMVGRGGEDWRELLERVDRRRSGPAGSRRISATFTRSRRTFAPPASSPSTSGWTGGGATRTRTRPWPAPVLSRPTCSTTRPAVTASWTNGSRRRCTTPPAPTGSPTTTASSTRWRASPQSDAGRR